VSFGQRLIGRRRARADSGPVWKPTHSPAGERREVGVVYVEFLTATALAQTVPAREVVRALHLFFETVTAALEEEHGSVQRCGGHAALGLYGVPVAHEDDAGRALRSALRCRTDLLALAAAHAGLDFAIGVSAGSVVVDMHPTPDGGHTAVGPPVEQATRLVDSAQLRFHRLLASEEAVQRAMTDANGWIVAGEVDLDDCLPILAFEPACRGAAPPSERL
jgi:adenylate cyclase